MSKDKKKPQKSLKEKRKEKQEKRKDSGGMAATKR